MGSRKLQFIFILISVGIMSAHAQQVKTLGSGQSYSFNELFPSAIYQTWYQPQYTAPNPIKVQFPLYDHKQISSPYYFLENKSLSDYAPSNSSITPKFQYKFIHTAVSEGVDVAIKNLDLESESCDTKIITEGEVKEVKVKEKYSVSQVTFDEICIFPHGTDNKAESCGYGMSFTNKQLYELCVARNAVIDGTETNPEKIKSCHKSNCTTASFLGIIQLLKTQDNWDELKKDLKCIPGKNGTGLSSWGPIYSQYIKGYGLQKLTKYLKDKYKIDANYQKFYPDQMLDNLKKDIPALGDPILISRKNYSGHSAIFSNYRINDAGKITHICYWTSNSGPSGTGMTTRPVGEIPKDGEGGNRCERMSKGPGNKWNISFMTTTQGLDKKKEVYPITPMDSLETKEIPKYYTTTPVEMGSLEQSAEDERKKFLDKTFGKKE